MVGQFFLLRVPSHACVLRFASIGVKNVLLS